MRNRIFFIALLAGFFLCVTISGTLYAQYHNVLSFHVGDVAFGADGGRKLRQATSTSREAGMLLGAFLVTWLTARLAPSKLALATVPVVAGAMLIPLTTPFGVVASIGLRAFSISLAFEAFEIVAFSRMDARQVVALWGVVDLAAESILRRLPSPNTDWVIPVSVAATLMSVIPILVFAASGERAGVEENAQEDVQQGRAPLTRSMRLDFSASVIGYIAATCFGALVDSNLEAVATNLGQAAATSGELYSSFVAGQLVVNALFLASSFLTGSVGNEGQRGFKARSATTATMVLGAVFAVFGVGIEFRNLTVTHGTLLLAGMLFAFVFIECKSSLARILFAARLPLRWIASLSAVATGTGIVVRYALYNSLPVGPIFWVAGLAAVALAWLHSQVSSGRLLIQLRRRS